MENSLKTKIAQDFGTFGWEDEFSFWDGIFLDLLKGMFGKSSKNIPTKSPCFSGDQTGPLWDRKDQ